MANLLESPGYDELKKDIYMSEFYNSLEVTSIIPRKYGIDWAIADAFLMGIRQGVHNERQRRKARQEAAV